MRVQDVMTKPCHTVSPTTAASAAWELMRLKRVHHLAVMSDGRLVGIVSDRDAGGRQGAALRRNRTVAELMSDHVITVSPETTIRRAANLMRGRSIGCLVVTDREPVVGIVTVSDLLTLLGRGADHGVASTERWSLRHRVPHRKRHQSFGAW